MKTLIITILTLTFSTYSSGQIDWISTFESTELASSDTFWNGSDSKGSFSSGKATFKNNYDTAWKVWDGFGVSNMTDTVTRGYTNQYSVISGSGVNYTAQYAVISQQATVVLDKQQVVKGCYVNNGTYPALSMKNGDGFAKKFGGTTGDDPDYFRIVAKGFIGDDSSSTMFYLADYRSLDNNKDYIINNWDHFDLSVLGDVDSIVFSLESSDNGQFGMNTPAFFCIDHFNAEMIMDAYDISDIDFENVVAKDSFLNGSDHDGGFVFNKTLFVNEFNSDWQSWTGWSVSATTDTSDGTFNNQYSCVSGGGFDGNLGYVTGYQRSTVIFPHINQGIFSTAIRVLEFGVNNSTYAYKTMKNGNQFAKKFGGNSGNDKDFFVLKVAGTNFDGSQTDTVEHFLADYRFTDNTKDYIQKDWSYVNIASILSGSSVVRLDFWVEGSDTGQFGLNTPGYFCVDNFLPILGSVSEHKKPSVNVYPNPTRTALNIAYKGNIKQVNIYDLLGNLQSINTKSNASVDVSQLSNGVYAVRILTDKGIITKQFIKE